MFSVRRWLVTLAWTVGTLTAFAVYLSLARTRAVNSDGASIALQAWDMLHGNPLLRGWRLADVTFYTTEVPQYALVQLVRGLGQDVVHVAAAMTYTLVVLFAALLAKGTATGGQAALRVALAAGIMLAPQPDSGLDVLLSSPDHLGTSVPVMAVWLILDRARPRWYVPVVTSLLLAWAQVGDTLVFLVGVLPLVVVCGARVLRSVLARPTSDGPGHDGAPRGVPRLGRRFAALWYEIALAGGAGVAAIVGQAVPRVIAAAGGYTGRPLGVGFAPIGRILGHNLLVTGQSLLLLPGADFVGLRMGAPAIFLIAHLAGVAVCACAIAVAAWRFPAETDRVNQILLVAIVANVAAFAVGMHVFGVGSAREIAPVLPFAAALAGRELARPLLSARPARPARPAHLARRVALQALGVVLAGYLAGLGLSVSRSAAPPQAEQLTSWLQRHHLGTGLSGYWEANVVTLTSGSQVTVRLVMDASPNGLITRGLTELKTAWYDPARSSADFVVLFPGIDGYPGFARRAHVLATFGKPARIYNVGQYTIWYWPKNLLADLRS